MCWPQFEIEKTGFTLQCQDCGSSNVFVKIRLSKDPTPLFHYAFVCRDCGNKGCMIRSGTPLETVEVTGFIKDNFTESYSDLRIK